MKHSLTFICLICIILRRCVFSLGSGEWNILWTVHFLPSNHQDSLSELKRKFKDVLRAYWRQHKSNHDGEDTDQYDVAHHIATNIFNLYWDKPNYAGLRAEKKEILNYFIKHIQLSKSREGQSSNPLLRTNLYGTSNVLPFPRFSHELSTLHRRIVWLSF
jgi:hypothetical protein